MAGKKEVIEITAQDHPALPYCISYNDQTYAYETEEAAKRDAYGIFWLRQLDYRLFSNKQTISPGIKVVKSDPKTGISEELSTNYKTAIFDIFLKRWGLLEPDATPIVITGKRKIKNTFEGINVQKDGKEITIWYKGKNKKYTTLEDAKKEAQVLLWYHQFRDYFFPEKSGFAGAVLVDERIKQTHTLQDEEIETILKKWELV